MKTATGLTVIAIGAILAFAVTTSPGFLNVQVVGWILIATGALGIALMPRSQDWLRRRVIIRRTPTARPSRPTRPSSPTGSSRPGGSRRPSGPRRRNAPQLSAAAPSAQPSRPAPAPASGVGDETIEEEYIEP